MGKETFEDIYAGLLEEWAQNPEQDIEVFVERKMKEAGVNDEDRRANKEARDAIERIGRNMGEIEAAEDRGIGAMQWLRGKGRKMIGGKAGNEQEGEIMETILNEGMRQALADEERILQASKCNEELTGNK